MIEGIKATKTKYCCIINADGSMSPKYLKKMLALCEKKDLIFTSRYQKPGGGSEDDDITTSIGNFLFTLFGNVFFKLNISDILFTYILGKTKSFKKMKSTSILINIARGPIVKEYDLINALDCLIEGRKNEREQKPSIGCNIKWK